MATTQRRAARLIRPMLATAGPLPPPPGGDDWAYALKWDGVRAVAYLSAGSFRLLSRTDQDMTGRYPELAPLAEARTELVLDGELVTLLDGKPSFSLLQRRMQVRSSSAKLVRAVPVVYFVFDVVHHDGQSRLTRPYRDRRALLDELNLKEGGLEGVVASVWTPPTVPAPAPEIGSRPRTSACRKSSSVAGPKDKADAPAPSAPCCSGSPTPTAGFDTSVRSALASPAPSSATSSSASPPHS